MAASKSTPAPVPSYRPQSRPVVSDRTAKVALTAVGTALVSAAPFLPPPWGIIAGILGGVLGGSALVRRPGDVKRDEQ
jgi:hypothetical protein